MVSRAWPPIALFLVGLGAAILTSASFSLPEVAASTGACQQAYGARPAEIPDWLQTPSGPVDLSTSNRYDYLAGQLLSGGLVDGSNCPSRGLNPDGSANACGLAVSRPAVDAWQNRYDPAILSVSRSLGLPPKVLKAVIAVESQFWPGANWAKGEIGLGQMTNAGADLVLRWRPDVYRQVCLETLGEDTCSIAYVFQNDSFQGLLRGRLLKNIDATCESCVGGIDPKVENQAVSILGETLIASCRQSAYIITSASGKTPNASSSYEDFWRFVLANYHSGAGCLMDALHATPQAASWTDISAGLSPVCAGATGYVRRIEEQIKP